MKISDSNVYIAGGYISMEQMYEEFVDDCRNAYTPASGEFEFSDIVLKGCEAIGIFCDLPKGGIYSSSSYRPGKCNKWAGSKTNNSQHITGNAIDIVFRGSGVSNSECLKKIWDDLYCKGELYQTLEEIGILGIGCYDSFIHLDDGRSPLKKRSTMAGWGSRFNHYGKNKNTYWSTSYISKTPYFSCSNGVAPVTGTPSGLGDWLEAQKDEEDGVKKPRAKAFEIAMISLALLTVAVLSFFVIRKRIKNK